MGFGSVAIVAGNEARRGERSMLFIWVGYLAWFPSETDVVCVCFDAGDDDDDEKQEKSGGGKMRDEMR